MPKGIVRRHKNENAFVILLMIREKMKYQYLFLASVLVACLDVYGCDDDSGSSEPKCPEGQTYNVESHSCEAVSLDDSCKTDADCKDGKTCQSGVCANVQKEPECKTDADCKDGKTCQSGVCADAKEPECKTDADCKDGKTCQSGVCADAQKEPECKSDADCKDGKTCQGGKCLNKVENSCEKAADCVAGELCVEGGCQKAPSCDEATPCPNGYDCFSGVCGVAKDCESQDDCDEGLLCLDKKCQESPVCSTVDDCPQSYICSESRCIIDPLNCETDRDCPKGLYCSDNRCIDPNVQCNRDEDCSGNLICKAQKCVQECKKDADCSDGFVCRKNRCRPECQNDSECTAPAYCKDQKCTTQCSDTSDCPAPYMCLDRVCKAECAKNSDCTGTKKVCDGVRCVECGKDTDCTGDLICLQNVCHEPMEIRYPCVITDNTYVEYKKSDDYEGPVNADGSINLCRIGAMPSISEVEDGAEKTCIALYHAREWDFYGDGIDSNCDGFDYDLKSAIFVYPDIQGTYSGSDSNSGQYEENVGLKPVATIKAALSKKNVIYHNEDGKAFSVYPDILVNKEITANLTEGLVIPSSEKESIVKLTQLAPLSDVTFASLFAFHSDLAQKSKDVKDFKANQYACYQEGSFSATDFRIYGGLTSNQKPEEQNLLWVHKDKDKSRQSWVLENLSDPYYVMIRPMMVSQSFSLSISDIAFEMSSKEGLTKTEGVTLIGLTCGKSGCRELLLTNVEMTVTAPDGMDIQGEVAVGTNGVNGINGFVHADDDVNSSYTKEYCPDDNKCGGVSSGKGGCAGYMRSEPHTVSSTKYDGEPMGKSGAAGADHEGLEDGAAGGAGLTVSGGVSHGGCDKGDIDLAKGTGAAGEDGANGVNGTSANLKLDYTGLEDDMVVRVKDNYADLTDIHGVIGGNGGGGGGGSVYQMFSKGAADSAWANAGSGGGGGCGGEGGKAGGVGGSAIGLLLMPMTTGESKIVLDGTKIHAVAGSGGTGQSGADGGLGGKAGTSKGYEEQNGLIGNWQCQKATAGGAGGHGGGGGAGAGGIAGRAVSYLLACNRNVIDDCDKATSKQPCFSAKNRFTLENCGFSLPMELVAKYGDEAFGSVSAGNNIADPEIAEPGKGAQAATNVRSKGAALFIDTLITKY